jgi:hypothetical protein
MALIVAALDRSLHLADLTACLALACAGLMSYAALCWLLDISRIRGRLKKGLALFRTKLANINIGQNQ